MVARNPARISGFPPACPHRKHCSMDTQPHALYRHFDATGRLLYVGITNDPGRRWGQHSAKDWWLDVTKTTIERFDSRAEVLTAERAAIEAERPWWNIQGNAPVVAYRGRISAALAEFAEETVVDNFMLRGLTTDCQWAVRLGFRGEIETDDRNLNEAVKTSLEDVRAVAARHREAAKQLDEEMMAADTVRNAQGAVYNWWQHGMNEAFRLIELSNIHDVKSLDVLAAYLASIPTGGVL